MIDVDYTRLVRNIDLRVGRPWLPFRICILETSMDVAIYGRVSDVKIGDKAKGRVGEVMPSIWMHMRNPPGGDPKRPQLTRSPCIENG